MASKEKITTKEIIDRLTTGAEMMKFGLSVPGKLLIEAADRLAVLSESASKPAEQDQFGDVTNMVADSKAPIDERARFEAWVGKHWNMERRIDDDGDDVYLTEWVQGAWMAWQAAMQVRQVPLVFDGRTTLAHQPDFNTPMGAMAFTEEVRQVPDGYVLMPKKMTKEIRIALFKALDTVTAANRHSVMPVEAAHERLYNDILFAATPVNQIAASPKEQKA